MTVIDSQREIKPALDHSPLLWRGDAEAFLDALPLKEMFDLVFTSPPYNVGKPYENPTELDAYFEQQDRIIEKLLPRVKWTGSICWQVGNHIQKGAPARKSEVLPLDILFFERFRRHGLKLRNRVIWHYGHGLHCKYRFSGRYETVLWFTKGDDYYFDLDAVRVKQKYPGKKHFKGPNAGKRSGNPKGKNPENLWEIREEDLTAWDLPVWRIPNVKSNHVERTIHPCQFPVALVDRFVLSMSPPDGLVFDPFAGVSSAGVASLLHGRRFWGCELSSEYVRVGASRLNDVLEGDVKYRPFDKPIYDPVKKKKKKHEKKDSEE